MTISVGQYRSALTAVSLPLVLILMMEMVLIQVAYVFINIVILFGIKYAGTLMVKLPVTTLVLPLRLVVMAELLLLGLILMMELDPTAVMFASIKYKLSVIN